MTRSKRFGIIAAGGVVSAIVFYLAANNLDQFDAYAASVVRAFDQLFTFGYRFMTGEWLVPLIGGGIVTAIIISAIDRARHPVDRSHPHPLS